MAKNNEIRNVAIVGTGVMGAKLPDVGHVVSRRDET